MAKRRNMNLSASPSIAPFIYFFPHTSHSPSHCHVSEFHIPQETALVASQYCHIAQIPSCLGLQITSPFLQALSPQDSLGILIRWCQMLETMFKAKCERMERDCSSSKYGFRLSGAECLVQYQECGVPWKKHIQNILTMIEVNNPAY